MGVPCETWESRISRIGITTFRAQWNAALPLNTMGKTTRIGPPPNKGYG